MGRFNEDDHRPRKNQDQTMEIDTELSGRFEGSSKTEGIDKVLENLEQGTESHDGNLPESISTDIDYEDIRNTARLTYVQNKNSDLTTPSQRELDIEINAGAGELADSLVDYLQDHGTEAMIDYAHGDLENNVEWANLIGFGLIDGENSFTGLGEYVSEQVFEYSE